MPQRFLDHASLGEVLAEVELTEQAITRAITGWVAAQGALHDVVAARIE